MRKTLGDVTFVIPTAREKIYTLDSIPSECRVNIEREGNINEARNKGIEKSNSEIIVVCDDDIEFSKALLIKLLGELEEKTLIGLEDYYPFSWCIGRFLLFWKCDWARVGGFDQARKHGGDTDFCIKMQKAGVKIKRIPRDTIFHYEHVRNLTQGIHIEWLWYLFRRHPKEIFVPACKLAFRKITRIKL